MRFVCGRKKNQWNNWLELLVILDACTNVCKLIKCYLIWNIIDLDCLFSSLTNFPDKQIVCMCVCVTYDESTISFVLHSKSEWKSRNLAIIILWIVIYRFIPTNTAHSLLCLFRFHFFFFQHSVLHKTHATV